MATILEFRSAPRPAAAAVLAANGTMSSAEIVIFPGVRYERHGEAEATKSKRSKRRRDTLELES